MQLMKYDEFKNKLVKEIRKLVPAQFKHYSIELHSIRKVNKAYDGICMHDKNAEKSVSPVIYTEELYDDYMLSGNFDKVVKTATDLLVNHYISTDAIDLDNSEDNIILTLMNYENNKEQLNELFYVKFYDMAIVFRWVMKRDENGVLGCLVTNKMAEAFGFDIDELYLKAMENTKRLMPVSVKPLNDEIKDIIPTAENEPVPVLLLTNKYHMDGAAYILYLDLLRAIKAVINSNFYIVPASVDEVLIIPTEYLDVDDAERVLSAINSKNSSTKEILSCNVYLFDEFMRKV